MKTNITFKTDKKLKEDACKVFESIGMSLTTALNIFMKQAVIKNRFPLQLDEYPMNDISFIHNKDLLSLFGKGKNLGFDEEPEELPF